MDLSNSLRAARESAGLSQAEAGAAAGISRQAYAAVEHGSAVPSTTVALGLARAFGASVEALFSLGGPAEAAPETAYLDAPTSSAPLTRATVHVVGERVVAHPLAGDPTRPAIFRGLPAANALVHQGAEGETVAVESLGPAGERTLVITGCDPATTIVAAFLRTRGIETDWRERGSEQALRALASGSTHVAGCHLRDGVDHNEGFNMAWIEREVPFPVTVISFANWQQGLVVAASNPKTIRGVEDLERPGLTMVNRGPGSGARASLDAHIEAAGLPVSRLAGYDREASGHLAVADAVAMGFADAGIAVQAAAIAAGLDFVPLDEERYDLVIPNHLLGSEPVRVLLDALSSSQLRRSIDALGGYDVSVMGSRPTAA